MDALGKERPHPVVELDRTDAGAEFDERQRNAFETELGLERRVALDQRPVLLALGERRIGSDRSGQFDKHEFELDVVRLLAPHSAIVEHRDSVVDGHVVRRRQQLEQRRLGPSFHDGSGSVIMIELLSGRVGQLGSDSARDQPAPWTSTGQGQFRTT